MKDADCVAFLQWALPKLGLRWPRITAVLRPGGYLVIGAGERLPEGAEGYGPVAGCREILRRQNPA